MGYIPLSKIFYQMPDLHQAHYLERFNSVSCKKIPFDIKQFNRNKSYPAFFCYTEELTTLLENIFVKNEMMIDIIGRTPPIVLKQFSLFCVIEEIQATNDIEGVRSTKQELRASLETLSKAPRFASIINSYNSIVQKNPIRFDTCQDIRDFYESFTYDEVLASDPSNRLDGKIFRAGSVDVANRTGKTIHRGLYPEASIISAMDSALQILHDVSIPLLVRLAVFHYLFSYIHPFYDGNGRTGRFIVSYFLAQRFNSLIALRLSYIFRKNISGYYKMFSLTDSEINRGDLTPFIHFFLSDISSAFDNIKDILTRKIMQLDKLKQQMINSIPADTLTQELYTILLQASSFFGYGLTLSELMTLTGKSRNTIQSRLNSMPSTHLTIIRAKPFRYKINSIFFKHIPTKETLT